MYTDDRVIYYTGSHGNAIKENLQEDLKRVEQWFTSNRLILNHSKTKRLEQGNYCKIALTWAPEGKRRRRRPKETWRRTVNKERGHLGFKAWRQAQIAARDKGAWRRRVNGPILHEERKDRWCMIH